MLHLIQLKQEIPLTDMAVQFLMAVSSSMEVMENRPKNNPSVDQIHRYTIETQIRDTAKLGRDAGNLGIKMLILLDFNTIIICRFSSVAISGWSNKPSHTTAPLSRP